MGGRKQMTTWMLILVIVICQFQLVVMFGIKHLVDELRLLNSYMSELVLNIEQESVSK